MVRDSTFPTAASLWCYGPSGMEREEANQAVCLHADVQMCILIFVKCMTFEKKGWVCKVSLQDFGTLLFKQRLRCGLGGLRHGTDACRACGLPICGHAFFPLFANTYFVLQSSRKGHQATNAANGWTGPLIPVTDALEPLAWMPVDALQEHVPLALCLSRGKVFVYEN